MLPAAVELNGSRAAALGRLTISFSEMQAERQQGNEKLVTPIINQTEKGHSLVLLHLTLPPSQWASLLSFTMSFTNMAGFTLLI